MNIVAVRPQDLTTADLASWREIARREPLFASPFFDPVYTLLLAEYRPQVEVAVWRDGDRAVGFFPFERHARSVGRPLGIKLADFQGVIADPALQWTTEDLLDGARLTTCHFDHLLANQPLAKDALEQSPSPWMDVSRGYETYLDEVRSRGSKLISQFAPRRRKLERELGPVTFTWNDEDEAAMHALESWKSAQRERSKSFNVLELDWVRAFLTRLKTMDTDGFQGMISTLRANGQILAVHLGMRTPGALHYWFPSFDMNYQRYSPGSLLMLNIAEESARQGIGRVDLGKGDDPYKQSLANACDTVAEGAADRSRTRRLMRASVFRIHEWIKSSPLRKMALTPKRLILRWLAQSTMRTK